MKQQTIQIKKQLPKEVIEGIQKMEQIQIVEDELEQKFQGIKKTSPFGQLPSIIDQVLDQQIIQIKKRSKIWNEIRGFCVTGTYGTLWQLAISSKLCVKQWGDEDILQFTTQQLKQILKEFEN